MNWVIPVLHFAYGFFRGVEQGYADRQASRSLGFGGGYDWPQHMAALSDGSGLPLVRIKANSAAFDLQVHGQSYVVVLVRQGEAALFSICSCIIFPRRRAPRDISAGLSRVNRQLEQCDYELIEGDDGDFYCVQARIRLDRLTSDAFQAGINEMMPHVLMLDKYLIENGYVG